MTREDRGGAVPPQGDPAGVVSRCLAAAVDALAVAGIGLAAQLAFGGLRLLVTGPPLRIPELSTWLKGVLSWAVAVLYLTFAWTSTGGTLGFWLLGLRVTTRDGRLLGVLRALLRAVLCIGLPVGLLWIPFSRRHASVQDALTATSVHYHRF
ncbi:RDD family protein [Streptomyces sp. Act143]|uniref:RDD family protein n=1 Tax=Streptomyces sp. Act143 TaxID=2200760 RepID=UPI000D672FA6|nr:RDD family protein [Streptomyces sp. Act143]PWI19948.1 RDD family protein [Streptomyces sp. Act143]